MKKLNRVNFLQMLGLLDMRFSFEHQTFETSIFVKVRAFLILLANATMSLKLFISTLFPRKHLVQLFIGSPYNYLPDVARTTMGKQHCTLGKRAFVKTKILCSVRYNWTDLDLVADQPSLRFLLSQRQKRLLSVSAVVYDDQ